VKNLRVTRGGSDEDVFGSFDAFNARLKLMALVTDGSQLDSPVVYLTPALSEAIAPKHVETLRDLVCDEESWSTSGAVIAEIVQQRVTLTRQALEPRGLHAWIVGEPRYDGIRAETLVRQLAHELNNPLTSVLWKLELLSRQLPLAGKDAKRLAELGRHVDEAHQGTRRVVELLKEFAESVQPWRLPTEHVDLGQVIEDALGLIHSDIEVVATLVKEFDCVPWVMGHHSRLVRVFSNLLLNALQAIKEAPVPQDHRIRVSLRSREEWVVAAIDDTGVGIPNHLRQKVFDPFVTTRADAGGSGLGLFISREIVESLGGHLEVASCELLGTSFRVWLPSADSHTEPCSVVPVSHRRKVSR